MVANACEQMLLNSDILSELYKQNASLAQKVQIKVSEFFAKLRQNIGNGARSKEVAWMSDAMDELQEKWENALRIAAKNQTAINGIEGTKNTATEGGDGQLSAAYFGFDEINKETRNNLRMRGTVVVNNDTELNYHINEALSGDTKKNLCFGALSETMKSKIEQDVGKKLFKKSGQYIYCVSYDDIRHISDHYSSSDEIKMTIKTLFSMLSSYESIEEYMTNNNTQQRLRIKKTLPNADYLTINIVSNQSRSLDLVTVYITKKNSGSQSVLPANSKIGVGQGSTSTTTNNIPNATNSQAQNSAKLSADADYLSVAEKYRDGTATEAETEQLRQAVEAAAKKAGYDHHLYHGTNAQFNVFNAKENGGKNGKGEGYGIYLSSDKTLSEAYGDRLIDAYVSFNRLAEGSKKTMRLSEVKKLIKTYCEQEAREMVLNGEHSSVNDALNDTFISNYVYTYDYRNIEKAYSDVADMLFSQNENDADIINEIMAASGAHYDYKNALKFYDEVLTPATGIDGFHYGNVYLAFSSNQIKSSDLVTYDDNGEIIPLSERFKSDNNDIRYSAPLGEDALDIGEAEQISDEDLLWNMRMEDAPEYAQETLQEYKQLAAEKNRLQRKLNAIEADAEKKTGISAMSKRQLQAKIRQLENQVKQAREQTKRTAAKREARLKNIDASSVIHSVADTIANERTLSRYAKAELHQLYSDVLALAGTGDKGTARGDPL